MQSRLLDRGEISMIRIAFAALLLAGSAEAAAQTAPQAAPAAPASAGQATYTPAEGWTKRTPSAAVTVLDAPEGDFHLVLVDVGQAADGKAAAAAAWKLYRPEAKRPVLLANDRPGRNGWDALTIVDYETSPTEHVVVQTLARRKGDRWTVMILEGNEATAEKRGGAINIMAQSVRPAGYARESFAGRKAHPLDPERIGRLIGFVRQAAADLSIPGVGIALSENGKIVYEGGVGVREMGRPEPVDAHTRFMIASNTKSMSTLLLARLVDEGKLDWDDPVTKVYPGFRLGSDETTRQVKVRHLVCACTGLPRKDFEWLFTTTAKTPPTTTFTQLAATEPTSKFGEAFQYNNLMATAAGYIGGHIVHPDRELGAAYDAAMQEKIFDPLGMRDTTFSMAKALAGDHATPHGQDIDGKLRIVRQDVNYAIAPYRPAGGAWSSPHDMILYIDNELAQGKLPNGKQLVSARNLLARRARGVPVGEDQWYGMGLMEDAVWGVSVIHHGGDLAGYHSDMFAIPDAGVGAVILTNGENGPFLRRPFMRRLLELMYDGRPEAAGDVAAQVKRLAAERAKARERLLVPIPAADAAKLAGAYVSPDLGRLVVERKGGAIRFRAAAWSSDVAARHNDDGTLSFITVEPAIDGLDFVAGTKDGKRILTIRDGQHTYTFVEAAS
jgi:CubicO group peptidase (beta-lactamase class C family)